MKHTKEPWQTVSTPHHDNGRRWIVWTEKGAGYGAVAYTTQHGIPWSDEERDQKEADAERIVSGVNAVAGICDPQAAIPAAREALEYTLKRLNGAGAEWFDDPHFGEPLTEKVIRTLALLNGQQP